MRNMYFALTETTGRVRVLTSRDFDGEEPNGDWQRWTIAQARAVMRQGYHAHNSHAYRTARAVLECAGLRKAES